MFPADFDCLVSDIKMQRPQTELKMYFGLFVLAALFWSQYCETVIGLLATLHRNQQRI